MYNILLGGAAGDGIETMSSLFEKLLKQSGFYVFTNHDFMSRVRGGHNFVQVRFGDEAIESHCEEYDGMFVMNAESFQLHQYELKCDGFLICDQSLNIKDERAIALSLNENAKILGNKKVATSIAIGAILSLFGIEADHTLPVLKKNLKEKLVDVNHQAIKKGCTLTSQRFHKPTQMLDHHMLLSGTEASTLGVIAAGLKFYSAYPMSPSTGILEYLSEHGEAMDILVEQAEDEIAAIHMAIGAAYAGAPAMTGTSGGGFCLMVEALGFAGIAEVPIVIANVQRPGPATGLPTRTEQSDLKFAIHASHGEFPRMVIALRHHADAFYQSARAMVLAKKYQIPIIILSDQYLGDATATIPLLNPHNIYVDDTINEPMQMPYKSYQYTKTGISPRLFPGKSEHLVHVDSDEHDEFGFIIEDAQDRIQMMKKRLGKLAMLETELLEPEFIGDEHCEYLIVGFGSTYGPIKEATLALNKKGEHYGALIFGDIYPLPTKALKKYSAIAHTIIAVEQNATAQLASLIREMTSITCDETILKYDGRQMTSSYIIEAREKGVEGRQHEM